MRSLIFIFWVFSCAETQAQKVVDVNNQQTGESGRKGFRDLINGDVFLNTRFVNLKEGTPYLIDSWMNGTVVTKAGERYSAPSIKFDLLANKLHILDEAGAELISSVEASEIWFKDTATEKYYHFLNASLITDDTKSINKWYQLLDTGKVNLYKAYFKVLTETLPYNSSTYEQRISTKEMYYLKVDNRFLYIKNISEVPEQFPDQRLELQEYLRKKSDKKDSRDKQWKDLIEYYNSLHTKSS